MKLFTALCLAFGAANTAAFTSAPLSSLNKQSSTLQAYSNAEFCAGLPGVLAPVGEFDPLGFLDDAPLNRIKRFREAEVTHGRVSMLAVVGFLVGEKVEGSSFLFDASISGPGIDHFQQVPTGFWLALTLFIGWCETYRAQVGWVPPPSYDKLPFELREEYYPGDIGFDPLGLKPSDPDEFDEMQTKELQHGRLAMLGAAGIVVQELIDGKGIVEHFQSVGF